MRKLYFVITLFSVAEVIQAQGVGVNTDGSAPDASAILDVKSTDKGLLVPRVSLTNVTSASPVTAPATGLLVYNTNASVTGGSGTGFYYWDGTQWRRLDPSNSGDWRLTGNAGTSPSTHFLGTTDNVDLVFRTNNTERMRILNSGNVGIGTTSPTSLLHVSGVANSTVAQFTVPSGWGQIIVSNGTAVADMGASASEVFMGANSNHPLLFRTNAIERARITTTGNVGIGTATPAHRLDVQGGNLRVGTLYGPYVMFGTLGSFDTRTTNPAPETYYMGLISEFKENVVNGLNDGGTYNSVLSLRQWSSGTDWTGGGVHQLGFTQNGNLWHRYSQTTGVWGPWRRYLNTGSATSRAHIIYARGTGLNNNANRIVRIDGVEYVNTNSRGLTLTIINKANHTVVSSTNYDTFGSATASDALATALNNMTNGQIGILTSYDAWEDQVTTNLKNAFRRLGLYKALMTPTGARRPYVAIFEASSSSAVPLVSATEVEHSNDANQPYAELRGWLIDGAFVSTTQVPSGLATPIGGFAVGVSESGNVGIGTTNPVARLTVVGDGTGTAFIGGGFCGGNYTGISLNGQIGNCGVYNILSSPTDQNLYINRPSGLNMFFRENNNTQMMIAAGGNVGIGTTAPNSLLDVRGRINAFEIAFRNADGGDDSDPYRLRKVQLASNVNRLELHLNDDANEEFSIFGNSCAGFGCGEYSGNLYHFFRADGTAYHAGNVGIGTTSPGYRLQVEGVASAQVLNFGAYDIGDPAHVDGQLFRTGGQAVVEVDDWFYVRDNDNNNRIRFNTDAGRIECGPGAYNGNAIFYGGYITGNSTSDGHRLLPNGNAPGALGWGYVGQYNTDWYYMYSDNYTNTSRREKKRNIVQLDDELLRYVMNDIRRLKPSFYKYKGETDEYIEGFETRYRPNMHLGLIVDEAPDYLKDQAFSGIDIYAVGVMALSGIQYQQKQLDNIIQIFRTFSAQGTSEIPAGQNSVTVQLPENFNIERKIPFVTITPTSYNQGFYVENITPTSFTVVSNSAFTFNWHATVLPQIPDYNEEFTIPKDLKEQLEVSDEKKTKIINYWKKEKEKQEIEYQKTLEQIKISNPAQYDKIISDNQKALMLLELNRGK